MKPKANVLLHLLAIFFSLFLSSADSAATEQTSSDTGADRAAEYAAISSRIRKKYDSNYVKLSTKAQSHYAVRMYRLTGEPYYAQQAFTEVYQITDRLNYYLGKLDSAQWRTQQGNEVTNLYSSQPRYKSRKEALMRAGDKRFALYLIYNMVKLHEYGLRHPEHATFVEYVEQASLQEWLLSTELIHVYAAQVVNHVYWLKSIGIADWTAGLKPAFEKAYPDDQDQNLDHDGFKNKLYGLTHIVLADSEYYQKPVSYTEHQWILEYFTNHQDRIIKESTADIQAEIGLCFLLAGLDGHPTLDAMRGVIKRAVHPEKDIVLSVTGDDNLSSGEHRNMLAYALLAWPDTLHDGPNLIESQKWRSSLPLAYQHRPGGRTNAK